MERALPPLGSIADVDHRNLAPIKLREPVRAELDDLVEAALRGQHQRSGLHALALGQEPAHLGDPVAEQQNRAAMIATTGMMQPDPDLEDALVEQANRPPLGVPL